MKTTLMTGAALLGAGVIAGPAAADSGIKLGVGGYFKEAYMVVFDDDNEGEIGNEHNTDGFFNDAEVHFTGSTTLDNGLEVGARIELEGENDDDQIDEAWVYFSGGFGEVRIGSDDEALANACIVPPGGTGNFSAFSPNQWGANNGVFGFGTGAAFQGVNFSTNTVCTGVDDSGDAQKIIYISPLFAGFQLTASYTPNGGDQNHTDGVGPHIGMPLNADEESRHNFSVYGTYSFEGDGWGLVAGAGGSWEGHVERSPGPNRDEQDFYQAGLDLTFGSFAIGGVFEYFNNANSFSNGQDVDAWVAGGGISYSTDVWTIGAQYSHQDAEGDNLQGNDLQDLEFTMDRVVLTGNYAMGPGINIDAELGYTWIDTDPEADIGGDDIDDYQAFEIGVGTNITF